MTQANPGKYIVCVDPSDVSGVAVRFACAKAKKRGGVVEILHVMEPSDIQSLFAVGDKMREERRQAAEALLAKLVQDAEQYSGITPKTILREGSLGEQVIAACMEDADINMLVLGAAPETSGRGRLISWLSGKLGDKLLVPLMLVPGNLTDQQISEIS